MKKIKTLVSCIFTAFFTGFVLNSCDEIMAALENAEIQKPSFNFEDISFNSLDAEGITMDCEYSIDNPYGVSLNVAAVQVDVACASENVTKIDASEGISIAAKGNQKNKFSFKIGYDSLLEFAKNYKNANSNLPFSFSGNITLNNSVIQNYQIPFVKNVEAPVVKPSMNVSEANISFPSYETVLASAKQNISVVDAVVFATKLAINHEVDVETLRKIDADFKLNFNLNVKNDGGSDWVYLLKNCSINTTGVLDSNSNALLSVDTQNVQEIKQASGSIPLTVVLKTIDAADFIASIINGSDTNPVFSLGSGVKFPGLGEFLGSKEIPLDYSIELPLNSITK